VLAACGAACARPWGAARAWQTGAASRRWLLSLLALLNQINRARPGLMAVGLDLI